MTLPKNPNKETLFTAETARMWLRMFARLYKRGVQDAADLDDEGACKEYLEATARCNVWGELTDRRLSDDPIDWQVTLNVVSREMGAYQPFLRYFRNMGRYGSNWFSAALPCALDWYRKGIADYIANPGAHDMARFLAVDKPLWGKNKIEKLDNGRMVDITQGFIRERKITDSEAGDRKYALSDKQYTWFRQRIANASRSSFDRFYG